MKPMFNFVINMDCLYVFYHMCVIKTCKVYSCYKLAWNGNTNLQAICIWGKFAYL